MANAWTWEIKEFKASHDYILSSRPTSATSWNPVQEPIHNQIIFKEISKENIYNAYSLKRNAKHFYNLMHKYKKIKVHTVHQRKYINAYKTQEIASAFIQERLQ